MIQYIYFRIIQNSIHVFILSRIYGLCRINGRITTSKSRGTISTNWGNIVGSPKKNHNPVSILTGQTWCNSKGVTETTSKNCKVQITSKGGHSYTTKGSANNQYTSSKGGYTQKNCTHHTIYLHHWIQDQGAEIQYGSTRRNEEFRKPNRNITNTSIFRSSAI